jgi:heme/flavin dehydrogenase (mycofactocin system)
MSMPVMISPTGVQAVHPDGEVAVARAAAARGVAMGLSSFASKPIEDVVAANPQTFFQMYWVGTRDEMLTRMERARRAGAVGLIATLDWSFAHGRDWGSPFIPEKINLEAVRRYAPQVALKPRWLLDFARTGKLPDLSVPNMAAAPGEPAPTFFGAYGMWMQSPMPSWEDVAWLREQWDGEFMLKGVMRVDDARRAVDAGVTAISVSNHGGNNLDGTPASIRALPSVVDAVGDQVDVLLDGGIRRGGDVAKAHALGAKAVMIGRAYLWGLAANGQAGVENVLDPAAERPRVGDGRPGATLGGRTQPRRPRDPRRLRAAARRERAGEHAGSGRPEERVLERRPTGVGVWTAATPPRSTLSSRSTRTGSCAPPSCSPTTREMPGTCSTRR